MPYRKQTKSSSPRLWAGVLAAASVIGASVTGSMPAGAATGAQPFTPQQLSAAYSSDTLPYSNYFIDMLDGFSDLKANHPEILAENDQRAIQINNGASAAQTARAVTDAHTDEALTMTDGLGARLGSLFSQALQDGELPKTAALLVDGDGGLAGGNVASTNPAKDYYDNERPFERLGFTTDGGKIVQRDTTSAYDGLRGQGSYPSGHTTNAYWKGTILATLLPQLAPQILARSSEAGDNRVVLGVHYPLDIVSGRMMGQAVADLRWSDPQFVELLDEAKTELQTVLAEKCGEPLASCIAADTPYLSTSQALKTYDQRMTYGFEQIGTKNLSASVPDGAENLLITAFPDLSAAQRREVLAATEIDSGYPLDKEDGSGSWQRLDLAAAMSAKVTVAADGTLTINGKKYASAASPTVDDLAQTGASQQRWLSVPNSRIVVNPLDYGQQKSEVQTSGGPQLPLGAGYYAADSDNVVSNLLSVYDASQEKTVEPFQDSFDSLDPAWTATDVTPTVADSELTLALPTSAPKNWGNLTRSVTVDLDQTPDVTIRVPKTTGEWALKVNDGTLADDISLSGPDAGNTGTFTFDVAKATGWSGVKTFSLRLFETGKGTSTTVDDIAFAKADVADGSAFVDNFDGSGTPADWPTTKSGMTVSEGDGKLSLAIGSSTGSAYSAVGRSVTVDLDKYPVISLDAAGGTGLWSLKLNDGSGDKALQGDTTLGGVNTFDVASKLGWSGVKTFTIKIYAINPAGGGPSSVSFNSIGFEAKGSSLAPATDFSTSWRADSLPYSASYASGGRVSGTDFFHDENSVTRTISTTGFSATTPVAAGAISGSAIFDAATKILTVTASPSWSYAVDLSGAGTVTFYTNQQNMLGGAGGAAVPPTSGGYWTANLPIGATTAIGVGFAVAADGTTAAQSRAEAASDPGRAASDIRTWTGYWNALLAKVPTPSSYDLAAVDAQGVTGAQLHDMYYRAWILNVENVLPAMPETGFNYPQVATGKASGWMKGPDGSHPSATWDSLLGMQYLAYVDPQTAIDAFKGMMTLTDAAGQLGGESLPSIKAMTAWTLYQTTGDRSVLTDTYTDLSRYLLWAQQNPRWINGTSYDHPNEHDSQFVASLIIDDVYAQRIAAELGRTSDVTQWSTQQQQMAADYRTWFLQPDGSLLQKYFTGDPSSDTLGNNIVITGALHAAGLDPEVMAAVLKRFDSVFDTDQPLAGLNAVIKAPDAMFTAYGLLDQGRSTDAAGFVEATLRDIVKTGQFSETYEVLPDTGLTSDGVRPSVFGAANVIDFVWMLNGVRSDQGAPTAVNLTGKPGSVAGLSWMGKPYSITTLGDGVSSFAGTAVAGQDCTSVKLGLGQSHSLGAEDGVTCVDDSQPGGGAPGDGNHPGGAGNPGPGASGGSGSHGSEPDQAAGDGTGLSAITVVGVNPRQHTITVQLAPDYAERRLAFTVHSTPRSLGTYALSSTATATLTLPADLEAGEHRLIATVAGRDVAEGTFEWIPVGELASTGRDLLTSLLAAGLSVLAAGVAIIVIRRRATQAKSRLA